MLIRNENEIEIWTDPPDIESGKRYVGFGIWAMIIMALLTFFAGFDYSIIEAYIVLLVLIAPGFLIIVSGLILIKKSKNKKMVLKVNSEKIEVFKKNKNIIILLEQISSLKPYSNAIKVYYLGNGKNKETKTNIYLSPANTNLVLMAIKEYKPDVAIKKNRYYPKV